MRKYRNLSEHLLHLEEKGLLIRVKKEIVKETELHPLVRWQYRGGIPEKERKAFLFENVIDVKGKKYTIPVAVAALAGNREIYTNGLGCDSLEEVGTIWKKAMTSPIPPVKVEQGAVQDVVYMGDDLTKEGGGFDMFPVPISTPGFDNAPYTTCTHWVTKDPDTGIHNMGNYRGHIKGRNKIGVFPCGLGQDIFVHWEKCKEKGIPLQAALVVGAPPVVSYAAVQKIPYGMEEVAVAGGLAGEAIEIVKCKTVDLYVPAEAEIVFEGIIRTDVMEPEGPFGESHGYMHPRQLNPYMEITCITHRKNPTWVSFISQVTPSESSIIKKVGYEPLFLDYLKDTLSIKSVVRVAMHEPLTNLRKVIVIQMKKPKEVDVWRALHASAVFNQGVGKICIAVDEDIDPENMDSVMWAMSYRMKPHEDVDIIKGMVKGHAPPFSGASDSKDVALHADPANESALLINAILKEPFPPVSLPKQEYMERAKEIWEELGLPTIKPEAPWFGYSLGQWDEELEEEADLAVQGNHYKTGDKLANLQVKV